MVLVGALACQWPAEEGGTVPAHLIHAWFGPKESLEVGKLPDRAREDMLRWYLTFRVLLPAPGRRRPADITGRLAEVARRTGRPLPSVTRDYYAFRKDGWRALVDRRLAGPRWQERRLGGAATAAERPAFVDAWKGILESFEGRDETGLAAHRALLRRLEAWEAGDESQRIPGYSRPPRREPFSGLPAGWSYGNLMRPMHRPAPEEAAGAKYGRGAMARFALPNLSTRVGLRVGQVYVFDDQEPDVRVNFLGVSKTSLRPLCFDVQDLASAAQPLHAFKPTLVDQKTGKKRKLLERDHRWFVVGVLTTVGYREDTGTTLIVEHGTAAVSAEFEARILVATNGRVTVDRGGIAGMPAYAGMFEGQPRGNFKFKATLESARVRLRNNMAALPGSVGKDRDHAPEQLYGLEKYNQKLLQAAVVLPPALAAELQFPILNWDRFVAIAMEFHRLDDARTDHKLEGWARCGHVRAEWRPTLDCPTWTDAAASLARMTPEEQAAVHALVRATPGLWRERQLSPQEVMDAGRPELTRVPDHALPMLMGAEFARVNERCEDNGLFSIMDREIDPEPLGFDATALIRDGLVRRGARYSVFLNPFTPERLVVCDEQLRFLGVCPAWGRIERLDREAAQRRNGRIKAAEMPALNNLARRGAARTREMESMRGHNAAVMDEHRHGPRETAPERRERRRLARPATDFLPAGEIAPRPCNPAPSRDEKAPAAEDDEGFWMLGADTQPATPAGPTIYSAADFL